MTMAVRRMKAGGRLLKGGPRRGVALIVVILVIAFLLSIGTVLLTVTGTAPRVSGNVRVRHQVFNAAEAGFDAAWHAINQNMVLGNWTDFANHYRTTYNGQAGLDDPDPNNPNYFRRLTDEQLVQDVLNHPDNFIYAAQTLPGDNRFSYTVFLINDEAGGGVQDDSDALLICIGQGPADTYVRLEIELGMQ